ncbi:MAG: TPM domain-containing protein [Desulfobacterales bacterium]|nr:MAG: TPM domain-containing protein [Desulfobacterales bacterium]
MKQTKKATFIRLTLVLVLAFVVYLGLNLRNRYFLKHDFWQKRPAAKGVYVYDDAGILTDTLESTGRYLAGLKTDYAIEAVIVTIPHLPPNHNIESLAAALFSNWKIGQTTGGRGILLILADQEKLIKIEVSYELEDVFTDIFCGYIEDKQLKAYFLDNQLNIGMVAVLEEIEQRAQIKHQADYTFADIDQLDRELLSGGAGAKRQLSAYQPETVSAAGDNYPAGRTPDKAWQTLIRSWEDKVRDPNLGVYTHITRLAYRDFQNLPDSRYEEDVQTYKHKPYEVIQDGSYAVIFFGKKQGWSNAPFLFCRTEAGWQFDIVHQRKYVRMGKNPHWGIERSDYPYVELLSRCPFWMNQDIPLEGDDIYRIRNDRTLADEIIDLEAAYKANPEDFRTVMQLGRLYTITSLSPQKRIAYLKKAKQLNPASPEPYKYLAIVYLDAFYQFETAIKEIAAYVKLRPDDVFGRNYLGYLYYCVKKYKTAIEELEKAVELKSDNCYALAKLSRAYADLSLNSSKFDLRRSRYRSAALEMLERASAVPTPNARRIKWLQRYLAKKGILE